MNENTIPSQSTGGAGQAGKKLWYIIGGILIIIILGGGISRWLARNATERVLEKATGVDIEYKSDGEATYSNEEGSVTVGGTSYPDNWPSDVPKYPNGEIFFSGSSNPQTGESGATVSFSTNDSPSEVMDYYKRELTGSGWQIEGTATVAGMTTLNATKGESTFGVWAAESEGSTQVTAGVGM